MNFFLEFKISVKGLYLLIRKRIKQRRINRLERVTLKELILIQLHHIFEKRKTFQKNEWEKVSYERNELLSQLILMQDSERIALFINTHEVNIPIRLLTKGWNTTIEDLAIFVEKKCAKLTENIPKIIHFP